MKKTPIFIFTVLLLIAGCSESVKQEISENTGAVSPNIVYLQTGTIYEKQEYVGQIAPIQKTTIATESMGKLREMYVKEGDYVKKGQILAKVDSEETQSAIAGIEKTITTLEAMQDSTIAFFDAQYTMTKNKVDQAKIAVDATNIGSGDSTSKEKIKEIDLGIETYQQQLANIQASFATKKKQLYQNAITTMQGSTIVLENIGNFLDALMGITTAKESANDAYEIYLGAKDTTLKSQLSFKRSELKSQYTTIKKDIIFWNTKGYASGDEEAIDTALSGLGTFIKDARGLIDTAWNMVDNSISSATFPDSQIDLLKNQIVTMKASLENLLVMTQGNFIMGVEGLQQAIENLNKELTLQTDGISKQIELLQQQKKSVTSSLQDQYAVSTKQYQEAQDGLTTIDKQKDLKIIEIQAQIDQAKSQLQNLAIQKNNANVQAPYNGIITEKFAEIGQLTAPGLPLFEIANTDTYEMKIDIPAQEVGKFSIGKNVTIIIPSQNINLTGSISEIKRSADNFSKKIEIKISITTQEELLLGVFGKAKLRDIPHTGFLIPLEYIGYTFGKPYVLSASSSGHVGEKLFFDATFCDATFCVTPTETLAEKGIIQ